MVKTAVIYARFSCSKQREASIEDQLRVCRQWCAREGYGIVAEYCDYAISGKTDERPEFQRMIANAGESSIVLVYMMDRFSRDEYDAPIYKRQLKKAGVEVFSAMEALPDGPERILVEKIYEGLAAVESEKISVRTKRGMEGNALKCMANGVPVFGYDVDESGRYMLNDTQAAFVREAFARRALHEPYKSIADDFAQRGVRSAMGKPCGYNMIRKLLTNERYTGVYLFGDVRVEGGMPAIIDRADFMRVQNIRGSKVRSEEDWGRFRLSGRAICSECGRDLAGVSGRGRHNVKYEYYACKKCGGIKPVRCDWLEISIAEALREMLADDATAKRIAAIVAAGDDDLADVRKQAAKSLRDAERGLNNIVDAIEQGLLFEGMQERANQLQVQKARAEADLKQLEAARVDEGLFVQFLQYGTMLTDEDLVDAFVYQAIVSTEDVVVTLNFCDEKEEPARLHVKRVLPNVCWLPVDAYGRTAIASMGKTVMVRFSRAA